MAERLLLSGVITLVLFTIVYTWAERNGDWMPYILCRGSFVVLVSLIMSPECRDAIEMLPHKARRFLRRARRGGTDKPPPSAQPAAWDAGRHRVPVANYNWDDDGDIVRVRVNLEGQSLSQEDAKLDMTPMGFELQIRTETQIHVLKVTKLNNVVVPDQSSVVVKKNTGKVTVKLKKWYDSSTWRHLIDTGSNPTVDHIASAVEKAGVAAKHVDGDVRAEYAKQLP